VDRTHSYRSITVKNINRKKNVRKKIKRKTKTNDAGWDDDGRIQEAERRSPTTSRVVTSDILTCLEGREPEEEDLVLSSTCIFNFRFHCQLG